MYLHVKIRGRKAKAQQQNQIHQQQLLFQRKRMSCPRWNLNPRHSTVKASALPPELPGQLSWQGFESTTQHNTTANLKPLFYGTIILSLSIAMQEETGVIYPPKSANSKPNIICTSQQLASKVERQGKAYKSTSPRRVAIANKIMNSYSYLSFTCHDKNAYTCHEWRLFVPASNA